ncbi:hypothetical protein OBBRIDRAFT_801484 [Obba rivulosa]|uniref:Uncharacterized protein n=1 Tax=Obba rivulosa TaxID=1052685 RepID=A0A8E2DQN3_9APHY|nr:hypothetical protein OBBRIDRAFT_801484 [Obba rivulosa]
MEAGEYTYTIKAKEPTSLDGHAHYPISPDNLIVSFTVDTAHVVPTLLDIPRLKQALSRTLSAYPLYAGRLERPQGPQDHWKIRFSNEGILVKVRQSDAQQVVPVNTVVQSPWTFSEQISVAKTLSGENEPLMKVAIIHYIVIGYTSVGFSCAHVIYQGLPPLDPPPKYMTAPPTPVKEFTNFDIPSMEQTYALDDTPPHLDPHREKVVRVDIRFTAQQLMDIQRAEATRKTKHIGCKRAVLLCPGYARRFAREVSHDGRHRGSARGALHSDNGTQARGTVPLSSNAGCNGLIWTITERCRHPEQCKPWSLSCTARRIRLSLIGGRSPEFVADMSAYCGHKFQEAAESSRGLDFSPPPGHMTVNSTYKYDWTSAHFGYPGQTQFFHTVLPSPRYIKIFQANPQVIEDGSWRRDQGMAEVTFYLQTRVKSRFIDILKAEHILHAVYLYPRAAIQPRSGRTQLGGEGSQVGKPSADARDSALAAELWETTERVLADLGV